MPARIGCICLAYAYVKHILLSLFFFSDPESDIVGIDYCVWVFQNWLYAIIE